MRSQESIAANVLWATDWPEEQETPRAILRIIMENGGEPYNDTKAWEQLSQLVASHPVDASSLIGCFIRIVLNAKSDSAHLQALEAATQAAEKAPDDSALQTVLHKRVLLCYRISFEYHRKISRYLISTSSDRDALLNKIQEHAARLAPFILCAHKTCYDLKSAIKHRPPALLTAITAICKDPACIAETGGALQAHLRNGFPFLANSGSEMDVLRETVFQLIMAIFNFNIHSDLFPHKDRAPNGMLYRESHRLQQILLKSAPTAAPAAKRNRKPKKKGMNRPQYTDRKDPYAFLQDLATEVAALREKIEADLRGSAKQISAKGFNTAMSTFYTSKDKLACLRNLRSSFSDSMVNSPKVPVAVHNRRLVFSLQQADRLCKILQSDDRLDSKLADEIAGSIYISIQRLMCSTRGTSDASQAARAIYERVQAIKADIQTFQLRRIDTVAFNSFINTLYKDPTALDQVIKQTRSLLQTSPVTERNRTIRQAYHKAIRVFNYDIPEFRLRHPDQIHHRDIQYSKNIVIEVLKKCQLLLAA